MRTESFSADEQQVLAALDQQASSTGAAAGHHVRMVLQASGMGKREIGAAVAKLVEKGVLERIKVTDADGLFYMAYRRVQLAE